MHIRARHLALAAILVLFAPAALAQDRARMMQRMQRFDSDGDGIVTREEFDGPERVWARLDRDGDGRVELEAPRTSDLGWVVARLDRDHDGDFDEDDLAKIREQADTDEDGAIQAEELESFILSRDRPVPRGEAPEVGAEAPTFDLVRLLDNERESLSDLLEPGKPVVLIFGSFT